MIKIKKFNNTEDKKRLLSNFFSLLILQGANYILPLITIPYLIRVLGVETFGLLAFATATITYFVVLTDYGFNLSATKEISIHRDNHNKLVEIFSSVISIKLILMFISFIILLLIVLIFDKFYKDWEVYLLTFGMVLGQVLFPVWFFQGIEKMKYITYLNILAKSIFTIAIFLFVNKQEDYYLVPLLTSTGFIIAGLYSLYIIKKEFNITFKLQKLNTIKFYLIEGWNIFLSRVYVNLYTTTNVLLLGLFTNNTIVGYYSIAEKIVVAIGGLFEPANQALYPFLSRKYTENKNNFIKLIKNISLIFLIISLSITLITQILKEEIIYIFTGEYSIEIISILTIFLFRIITYPFGSLFSNTLIIMEKKKEFMKTMNYTVIINFLIVPISIYYFGVYGLVNSLIILFIIHIFLLIYYVFIKITKESYD